MEAFWIILFVFIFGGLIFLYVSSKQGDEKAYKERQFEQKIEELNRKQMSLQRTIAQKETELAEKNKKAENFFDSIIKQSELIIDKGAEMYPRIAAVSADLKLINYDYAAKTLEEKAHPAYMEAMRIRELRKQTKDILFEKNLYEYKYNYIVELFPNVEDIFDSDFDDSEKEIEL